MKTEKQNQAHGAPFPTLPLVEGQHSMYSAECLCGHTFEAPRREYHCPYCGRFLVIEWGAVIDKQDGGASHTAR
jgi:hypothetical protein